MQTTNEKMAQIGRLAVVAHDALEVVYGQDEFDELLAINAKVRSQADLTLRIINAIRELAQVQPEGIGGFIEPATQEQPDPEWVHGSRIEPREIAVRPGKASDGLAPYELDGREHGPAEGQVC